MGCFKIAWDYTTRHWYGRGKKSTGTPLPTKLTVKDGVLSALEHHFAGSYNLPFTGFILISIGADLLRITTKHYPMRKKFVN
jgi:hypothetical protein